MEAKELIGILRTISRELPNAYIKGHPEERLMHAITHIAEFFEAEQLARKVQGSKIDDVADQVRVNTNKLEDHEKLLYGDRTDIEDKPGIARELALLLKSSKRTNGILWTIVVLILGAFAMRIMQLMGFQIK